jgi:type II secretory pathway pseudopilin PulG
MRRGVDHRRAFTLLELIVVFTVICLLFALLIPATVKMRARAQRISCVNNLKNTGVCFRVFANATDGYFFPTNSTPPTFDALIAHWRSISNEMTIASMTCPSDVRRRPTNGSFSRINASYFVGIGASEKLPQSILAGDRNITTNGVSAGTGVVQVDTNSIVGWDIRIHKLQGNTAFADGRVQQSISALLARLVKAGGTNQFVVP